MKCIRRFSDLQGRLDAVDVEKAVEFVLSCMNLDGGFGCRPGSESHAGQVSFRTRAWEHLSCFVVGTKECLTSDSEFQKNTQYNPVEKRMQ